MLHDNQKNFQILELDKVLELLKNEAALNDAKSAALDVLPSFHYDEVLKRLDFTHSAFELLKINTNPNFGSASDNSESLKRAERGGVLTCTELLKIADTLRSVRTVKNWRYDMVSDIKTDIDFMFAELVPNRYFEDKIYSAIKNEEELNDDASLTLMNLRRKITAASANIREKLEKTIKGPSAKYLQDAIITQRDGRFVVPVKSEFRGEFSGIVHDSSASGATLFIEPMAVVEINNDLRVLRLKEKEEVERILSEFSSEAANFSNAITDSYKTLVELSLLFAKANLAYKMRAVVPKINTNGKISLKNARHPLISNERVVPISVNLGYGYNTLVITGPNTGGKTVTLKTVGLLSLMALCGLMIPCDDGSEICVWDQVLVDIGDEQSIEQSLSTFSSHMVNVISILEKATPFSLVLIDELGSGTDPIEGAALAKSILISLLKKGAKTISTTHYAELKTYAVEAENVENASCEFDVENMRPTYKLIVGIPGRSNAFSITQRLGMDKSIIDRAKSFIDDNDKKFEHIIRTLEIERNKLTAERKEAEELKIELTRRKNDGDKKDSEFEKERQRLLDEARKQTTHIIDNARYKSNVLLNDLEDLKKSANLKNAADKFSAAKGLARSMLNDLEKESDPVLKPLNQKRSAVKREFKVGDKVRLIDLNKDAEIVEIKNQNSISVSFGSMRIWTSADNLELKEQPKKSKTKAPVSVPSKVEKRPSMELDIRGMASDEGIIEVDRFIDNALLLGLESVSVIHGKGTGVLRSAVHRFLKGHKAVKSYRLEVFGEGESGVTIVELKN